MSYGSISLEKRIKDNINAYTLGQLLDIQNVQKELECISALTGMEFLLTRRHGEAIAKVGEWTEDITDVMEDAGFKIRVLNHTVGHFYYKANDNAEGSQALAESLAESWSLGAEKTYLYKETDQYVSELQVQVKEDLNQKSGRVKADALTGTLTHTYFHERMKVLDRSQVAPVAAVCVNINDWKYANDHFGMNESDRLIRVIADILNKHAKPEYIIGRVDGDVFNVMIPMPDDGEAEEYKAAIQTACDSFQDEKLAPSVAVGIAMKSNVEETMEQIFSDAEYEMFENKMWIKQQPGYRERLEKA